MHWKRNSVLKLTVAAIFGLIAGVWISVQHDTKIKEQVVLLERMRDLGELRTASYQFSQVKPFQSKLESTNWMRHMPGISQAVDSLTYNEALIKVEGEVDAGFNFKALTVQLENGTPVVVLPKPRLFTPRMKAWVYSSRTGLLWRDDNMVPKAQEESSGVFSDQALASGIMQKASDNAKATVTEFCQKLGFKNVIVRFS